MSKYEDWKHEEATIQLAELDSPNSPEWDRLHDNLMESEEFDLQCREQLVDLIYTQTRRIAELQRRIGIGELVDEPLQADTTATVGQPLSARSALTRAHNALSLTQHPGLRADLYATLQQLVS